MLCFSLSFAMNSEAQGTKSPGLESDAVLNAIIFYYYRKSPTRGYTFFFVINIGITLNLIVFYAGKKKNFQIINHFTKMH